MSRREFPKPVKVAAWKRCGGFCEGKCGGIKLHPGHFDYHHDKEGTFGGEPVLENCVVLCDLCHDKITKTRAPVIAKSNRIRNKFAGIKKPRTIRAWRRFGGAIVYASRER